MHYLTPMATKPNTFRVYLNEEHTKLMAAICEKTELGQSELLSKATAAALKAIYENECRFALPLKFRVTDATEPPVRPVLNEPTYPKRK